MVWQILIKLHVEGIFEKVRNTLIVIYKFSCCSYSGFRTVHLQGQEISGVRDRAERRRDPDRSAEGEQVHRDQLDPQGLLSLSPPLWQLHQKDRLFYLKLKLCSFVKRCSFLDRLS